MASRHRVYRINKKGNHYAAHDRISHIGGVNDDSTRKTESDGYSPDNLLALPECPAS